MFKYRFACVAALSLLAATPAAGQTSPTSLSPQLRDALASAERSVKSRESSFGASSPQVADALASLAQLECDVGDLARAEEHARKAHSILEGKNERALGAALSALARVAALKGDSFVAEELQSAAVDAYTKALGDKDYMVGFAICTLGYIQALRGDFQSGESKCLEGGLSGRRAAVPADLEGLWELQLGVAYHGKGLRYNAAKSLQEGFSKLQDALGPEHPSTAMAMSRLASFYLFMGDIGLANRLQTRSLEIRVKVLGANNRWTAESMIRLAEVRLAQKDTAGARDLYRRALSSMERGHGPDDPGVAEVAMDLGAMLWNAHEPGAEELFQRALAIREKAFGSKHKLVADALRAVAMVDDAAGRTSAALERLDRAEEIYDEYAGKLTTRGSEEQRRANADKLWSFWNRVVSFQARSAKDDPKAVDMALRTVLRNKGRVLDAMADSLALVRESSSADDAKLVAKVNEFRDMLAQQVLWRSRKQGTYTAEQASGNTKEVTAGWIEAGLERFAADADAALSLRAEKLGSSKQVTKEQIAAALPQGTALVEMLSYRPFDPKAAAESALGPAQYAGYVLYPSGRASFVDLGPAAAIDEAVRKLRTALSSPQGDAKAAGRQLDSLVMKPIRTELRGTRVIYLSPDGALNLVPFGALVDDSGNYLVESTSITYLASGRDLLHMTGTPRASRSPATVLANPDYGTAQGASPGASSRGDENTIAVNLGKVRFTPLPGTAQEAQSLSSVLPGAKVASGAEATEEMVKGLHGPKVLHIATHGFFIDGSRSAARGNRALELDESAAPPAGEAGKETKLDKYDPLNDPLLRSGLALSHANELDRKGQDGWLTAFEAMTLDLAGTQLVVLSACETGVGEVSPGEGVFGLRRALVVAGSQTQVMSLWKVDDEATRDLMVAYYKKLQASGGRSEALREVQLEMLSSPGRSHPYYWASFIPSGDSRSLEGKSVEPRFTKVVSGVPSFEGMKQRGCACDLSASEPMTSWGWVTLIAGAAVVRWRRRR